MSCHVYRNVGLGIYRDFTVDTSAFEDALGGTSSATQQHRMGIEFTTERSRHSTHVTQEIDLEAARDDSNFASREKVAVVELDKGEPGDSKEIITEKAEI